MIKGLEIYHRLPALARQAVASVRGYQLGRWRYGPETDDLVQAAHARETWDAGHWQEWQQSQLKGVLQQACQAVPAYRELWQRRQTDGDARSPLVLTNWPLLSKAQLRQNPEAFLAAGVSRERLRVEHTSGTTGTPLQLWQSRAASRAWYALMEARWRAWYGLSRADHWAILGGQMVTPIHQKTPPYWVWNAGLKQLYLSSYHISADTCASYFQVLFRSRVTYLWGYASSLFSLALFAREQQLVPPPLRVIISNAEPLAPHQRALISQVFGCPVRDTYGMCEMVAAASECDSGRLHLWPEVGLVEVLADDRDEPVPFGVVGRLVCTGLINQAMPLIRYDLGDRGALADPSEACPCGRSLPVLQSVEGRVEDIILTADHRRIGRIDPVFKAGFPIREAQVIQETLTSLRVRVVPDLDFTEMSRRSIVEALHERVGGMSIAVECVTRIPRGENGKFRAIISHLVPGPPGTSPPPIPSPKTVRSSIPLKLKLFHALPPFARNWAAGIHGYSLKASRYSRSTHRLTAEALERDTWPSAQWLGWVGERQVHMLRRAAQKVPYYRQFWERRRLRGDKASLDVLAHWPLLKKEVVRNHPELFLADDCDRRQLHAESTSGTTGTPLQLWRSRQTNHNWYALLEARIRQWNGLSNRDRWGHIGGQPVVPFAQSRPPYWVWNAPLRQLYLSCMHISPQSTAAYLGAIRDYKLDYLLGYSSSIALLAQAAIESGVKVPLKAVLTDSEPLLDQQRSMIERGFSCPVRETYGMAEIACAASQCSAGRLHLWPEVGLVELLDEQDLPVAPGQTGRIIATSLLNPDMPLIRYDTQDLAQADPDDQPCPCGRTLPRLRKLLGRNDDVVITADGRRLVQIDRIFDPCFDIREAQIVQDAIGLFRIRIVPGPRWTQAGADALCAALRDLVGEARITVEIVSQIERTWAGKHRMIVSHVSASRPS